MTSLVPLKQLALLALQTFAVISLGVSPWVSLHVWYLIANRKIKKGITEGQPGYGWLNTQRGLKLPMGMYSFQFIIFWCILFVVIIIVAACLGKIPHCFAYYRYNGRLGEQIFVVFYLSQLIVLYHISKERGFYFHEPNWLLSFRMFFTIVVTILVPIAFGGIGLYPLYREFNIGDIYHWSNIVSLVALPFPYYCHQSLLLAAKHFNWKSEDGALPSEISGGRPTFWRICLIMVLVSFLAVVWIRITGGGS